MPGGGLPSGGGHGVAGAVGLLHAAVRTQGESFGLARIVIIEDEPVLGRNLRDSLEFAGHAVELAVTGEEGVERVLATEPDLVLLDLMLPQMSGMDVMHALKAHHVDSSIVMMTAHGDIETAVRAIKDGAEDFITKSGRLTELNLVLERVLRRRELEATLSYLRDRERGDSALDRVVGRSAAIGQIKTKIRRLAAGPAMQSEAPPTILITGETGTGKDLIARAIHYEGPRSARPFVYVNCTAIPSELFESELFGHVKGAFTDARTSKKGLFEVAQGGTIFLDEIGHLPLSNQAKLLAAIEKKSIRPVGATTERGVDVHVIAATNRDLHAAIAAGEFRQDLYHRLCVVTIEIPPLRQRDDDIEDLTLYFVAEFAQRAGVDVRGVTPDALAALRAYDWPGNVRELSHVVESIVLMLDGDYIRREHLPIRPVADPGGVAVRVGGQDLIELDFAAGQPTLEEVEQRIIQAALEYAKHNVSRAARILGITRDALRYRVQKKSKS